MWEPPEMPDGCEALLFFILNEDLDTKSTIELKISHRNECFSLKCLDYNNDGFLETLFELGDHHILSTFSCVRTLPLARWRPKSSIMKMSNVY